MKEFRKTDEGFFVCEECKHACGNKASLSKHVIKYHNQKLYYDKWLKDDEEGVCKICGNYTEFVGFARNNGYKPYCSKKCIDKGRYLGTCKGIEKLFGVKNQFQREDVKENIKKICLQKYNVEYYTQTEKAKESQKQTFLRNYGVEHNMQNKDSFNRQQKSGFKVKKYKNTEIYYRGSYELDFLQKFHNKYVLENAPSISYFINNKKHIYFPDFYISSLNLIIEIKSSYYYNKYKDICILKQKAAINNGFKYILVIDKNYLELNLALKSE